MSSAPATRFGNPDWAKPGVSVSWAVPTSEQALVDAQLATWAQENTLRLQLTPFVDEMQRRLEAAGFTSSEPGMGESGELGMEMSAVMPSALNLLCCVRRHWRQPGCEVGFYVDLMVTVEYSVAQFGQVSFSIEMQDDWSVPGATGLFNGNDFYCSLPARLEVADLTFASWLERVRNSLSALRVSQVKWMLDDAMKHLDKVSTP